MISVYICRYLFDDDDVDGGRWQCYNDDGYNDDGYDDAGLWWRVVMVMVGRCRYGDAPGIDRLYADRFVHTVWRIQRLTKTGCGMMKMPTRSA